MNRSSRSCGFSARVFGLAAVVVFFLNTGVFANEPWVRIESENKEFSIAVPAGLLVNEETTPRGKRKAVFGFEDGVNVEVTFSEHLNSKENLARVSVDEARKPAVMSFEIEGFKGKSITYDDKDGYEHTIYMASNKGYYVARVGAKTKDEPAVGRYLRSIRAKGKPLIVAAAVTADQEKETVSAKSLKISPEVKAALDRDLEKIDRKIGYEPLASLAPCEVDHSARPAFIVSPLQPDLGSLGISMMGMKSGDLRVKVDLLANGQVGNIVVYTDIDRPVARAYAEAAKKLRFVPAQKNGAAVDSCEVIRTGFGVTTSTRIFTSQGFE